MEIAPPMPKPKNFLSELKHATSLISFISYAPVMVWGGVAGTE